jgi:bifunctional non-homologous end joining protein LigD
MSLKKYHAKRNFKQTPEPKGKKPLSKKKRLLYVIQKHAARRLHYDFRLELNGTLKSWAVPKGPSLDPSVKRLAVHVEDHPIEYGSFVGVIPAGQYGAGTVERWDIGTWECLDPDPNTAYRRGTLSFRLKGKKLKGAWKLVQIKQDPKNWLLIKVTDEHAESNTFLDAIYPQLATLVDKPPSGNNWLHEVKFDGYRLITMIAEKDVKLMTRNQHDWTKKFTPLKKALAKLNLTNTVLDGELVATNKEGHIDFQILQNMIHDKNTSSLIYYVFDIIFYKGKDLTNTPLLERKKILKKLIPNNKNATIRYSDHVIGDGNPIYKQGCKLGLEGIVSKAIDSPYVQKRSTFWLKTKCINRQEFIVGGFTKPKQQRKHFGSLLIGVNNPGGILKYCGHVGTGFTEESLANMKKLLDKYKTDTMPFDKVPPDSKNAYWVKPKLMVELEFRGWTKENILRQASFKGLRSDKPPKEITIEKPQSVYALSNPEKILYGEQGITKRELAQFYDDISEWILPYIINRPLTLVRCPHGYENKCFFQRHVQEDEIKSVYPVRIKESAAKYPFLYIKDKAGLIALVQLGVLEIHPWGARVDNPMQPDMIIFDLDPGPNVVWEKVVKAAHFIHDELKKLKLVSFVKTTGGKGLHICIPIKRQYSWDEVKAFSHAFVNYIVALKPDSYVSVMTKSKRPGKIFIDYLRNQRGATAIAAYSTRAKQNAPIATPLDWKELTTKIKPDSFTIKNLLQRLKKLKKDPWQDFFELPQILKIKSDKY